MELFDYLKSLTERNEDLDFDNEEIRKGYQPYMINRFVSMVEVFIPIVNEINKYDVPKNIHYKYLYSIIPKRKQFFNYIKKKKDLTNQEKIVIANYFEVGLKEAEKYIDLLEESQIKEILEIYRYGKNNIAGI
jgi:hypothetical protein